MPYALITGASKGIGKEIAYLLADKKHNLLLIARSQTLLKELTEEIIEKYKIKAAYLVTDLSKDRAANDVYAWCSDNNYDVNILVNNAGYGLSGPFEKYSTEEHEDMMHVNMNTLIGLCRLFLTELKKQQQSYIMNIASTAAYQSVPYLSLYSASKAFVLSFSRGLRYELKGTSISVTCVCPGGTDTDFANRAQVGMNALKAGEKVNMSPKEVAEIGVKGLFNKKAEVITGALNKFGAVMAWLAPKSLSEMVAAKLYKD